MSYQPGDSLLNKYRIEKSIGRGAFGEVSLVTHLELEVFRAVKILHRDAPGLGSTEYTDFESRFALEARLGARLDSPHIVRVYDFEHQDRDLLLVMEYCPGGSLKSRLDALRVKSQKIPLGEALGIAKDIARGLAALHALDVVHRDLKPNNILFDETGHAKIADLGLAQIPGGPSQRSRISMGAPHPGTPGYMSPEQETGTAYLKPASDVYAFGLILFEMLTGRTYKGQKPGTTLSELRPQAPAWLDALLAQMLDPDPMSRPWNGAEALRLFEQGAASGKLEAGFGVKNRFGALLRSRPLPWVLLFLIVLCLVGLAALLGALSDGGLALPGVLALLGFRSTPTSTPAFSGFQTPIIKTSSAGEVVETPLRYATRTATMTSFAMADTHTPAATHTHTAADTSTLAPTMTHTSSPTLTRISAPEITDIHFCDRPCDQAGAVTVTSYPEGSTHIYAAWSYRNMPAGLPYTRVWSMEGQEWVRYDCVWQGPEQGQFEVNLWEAMGLRSGIWTVTFLSNGVQVAQAQVFVEGNHSYWDPAGPLPCPD